MDASEVSLMVLDHASSDNYLYDLNITYERIKYLRKLKIDAIYAEEIKPEIERELKNLIEKYMVLYTISKLYNDELNSTDNKVIISEFDLDPYLLKYNKNDPNNASTNIQESFSHLAQIIDNIQLLKKNPQNMNHQNVNQNFEIHTPKRDTPQTINVLEDTSPSIPITKPEISIKNIQKNYEKTTDKPSAERIELAPPSKNNLDNIQSNLSKIKKDTQIAQTKISKNMVESNIEKQIEIQSPLELSRALSLASDNVFMVPIVIGAVMGTGGVLLTYLSTTLSSQLGVSLTVRTINSYLNIMPGMFLPSNTFDGLSFNGLGLITLVIGFNLLLIGYGLFRDYKAFKYLGVCVYSLSALIAFGTFIVGGLSGAPYSLLSLVINSCIGYLILRKLKS